MSDTDPPLVKPIAQLSELQALTDAQLWRAIGQIAPGAPARALYEGELLRRASKATIEAAKSTRHSVIVATAAIVIAALVQVGSTLVPLVWPMLMQKAGEEAPTSAPAPSAGSPAEGR